LQNFLHKHKLFLQKIHPKSAHSVTTVPGNLRQGIDHKKVKTMWFHTWSGGNACSEL